jgi:hypothetical protein
LPWWSFSQGVHRPRRTGASAPVKSYTEAVRLFADFLAGRGHSLTVDAITRDDVRAFVADQLERWSRSRR